jgi:hypothetical protein
MRQLNWKIRNDSASAEALDEAMSSYRDVLYEWNDNLNRNLALVQCYFGKDARKLLEGTLYEKFKEIGSFLEQGYLDPPRSGKMTPLSIANLGA